ncbi:DMT family transporter [Bariatricus sp. SGI.161]|uniref:DMT family transporter n=1 Tax=Bariatricus sp. SGI.161 TaxID=3420550 RepID=UPI002A7B061E|nr:DMT family transporter [Lachnospiraceae bacterium]
MRPKNAFMLILTAFIWGTAFVAQSVGMDYLGPFTFNGVRSLIGGVALIPCIWLLQKLNDKSEPVTEERNRKDLLIGGISCGVLLFAASSLQQVGIQYTTAGKAGFITAFYIVFVPVLGIFLGKKTGWKVWTAVILALAGLYFLCITEKFTIGKGDIFLFACALVFSLHILVIDYFSPKVEGVKMSCIQFLVCGIISLPFMFLLETPRMGAIVDAAWPLLYAGVLSCGVAYTLQIIGQKNVNPAIASLILSLESCFSVLAGWVILGEKLSVRESIGCILMFAAIILAQLPDKKDKEMAKNE